MFIAVRLDVGYVLKKDLRRKSCRLKALDLSIGAPSLDIDASNLGIGESSLGAGESS